MEKTIRAFSLLEALAKSGCPFLFKGGSALMLQLACTQRLSIDIGGAMSRVPCHGWIWADIVARKGRPPLAQVRTLSAAGPHFCPGPATVFGLLCILASPVPNKTTDRRHKSHRPGTMRYQTLLGMSIISKNNRVFALSQNRPSVHSECQGRKSFN